uniref:Uncharacterized protein n=1 Tax=Caenorhabditis japonica TaxID=281687 RepID=A0A8R1EVK1_CAEJA
MLRYYLHEVIGSYRANVPGETIDARHHSTSYGPGPSEAPSMSFVKCGTPRGHSFLSPTDFSLSVLMENFNINQIWHPELLSYSVHSSRFFNEAQPTQLT